MRSMPAISGGRPATVTPNTTSSRPVRRPSMIAHAVWMKVLSVRPCRRACLLNAAVSGSVNNTLICSGATGIRPASAGAIRVASSSPANVSRQAATAAARSCPAIQVR